MSEPARDQAWVGSLNEEQLVRRVVRCRRAGDRAGHDEAAAELAARVYDYIATRVRLFKHPQAGIPIPRDDHDDVTQDAYLRTLKMLDNLREPSVAAFRAALRTTVANTCLDWCRRDMTRDKGLAGSVDDTWEGAEGEPVGRLDKPLADVAVELEARTAAALEAADALKRAFATLPDARMRAVIELTDEGYSSREIGERLDLSRDNVDQLRSRGYRKLREVLRP